MSSDAPVSDCFKQTRQLKVLKQDEKNDFIVQHPKGNLCIIENTYAEMFPMWLGRILITAATEKWALTAARSATGYAASVIMSPAEAGIETSVSPNKTLDKRPGVIIQIHHIRGHELKSQMITRIGQCIMTCPTTSAFDVLPNPTKKLKVGKSLSLFGDHFQTKDVFNNRTIWRIPVMEGEFLVEDRFGVKRGVAGGNFLILAKDQMAGLKAAESAVLSMKKVEGVILPFPGGICRSGSKIGSIKYKLTASTNHYYCPTLKNLMSDSRLSPEINSVYEIVVNGLNLEVVKRAMALGIEAACSVSGVKKITAANYGGKLGPYKAPLEEFLKRT
ncbi:MAG: formylmethanofuran--tetrahydromethanopterin N-formyltransferase [Candidatus Sifarchaeia archaeon]|jgi:formylmethanofuran--tetrahydromethanopterin N-formyltransferase